MARPLAVSLRPLMFAALRIGRAAEALGIVVTIEGAEKSP
jgi:hypothetical protein